MRLYDPWLSVLTTDRSDPFELARFDTLGRPVGQAGKQLTRQSG